MLHVDAKPAYDAFLLAPSDASPDVRPRSNSAALKSPTSPLASSISTKDLVDIKDGATSLQSQRQTSPPTAAGSARFSQEPLRGTIAEAQLRAAAQNNPQPYLPLRKKLTRSLKLGLTPSRRGRNNTDAKEKTNEPSMADFALSLRPTTSRSSQDSSTSRTENDSPRSIKSNSTKDQQRSPKSPGRDLISGGTNEPRPPPMLPPPMVVPPPMVPPPMAPLFLRSATSNSEDITMISSYRNNLSPAISLPDGSASPAVSEFAPNMRPPMFWNDNNMDSARESVRSIVTNSSSMPDLSSNGRTSGATDRSSTSDAVLRDSGWTKDQNDELTVEDCIMMYARGFTDDPPTDEIPPIPEEAPTRALNISDQTEVSSRTGSSLNPDPIKSILPALSPLIIAPMTPSEPEKSPITTYARSEASMLSRPSIASTLSGQGPKPPRDRYGFKKETQHVKLQEYDVWYSNYSRYMERRRRKWVHFMNETGLPSNNPQYFPEKSDKVKRYIRKGIPPEWRGAAWFFYADGASFITTNPGLYQTLVAQAAEGRIAEADREHIERDLHRTLPENKHFKPDMFLSEYATSAVPEQVNDVQETEMILSLRRILQAFAIHHPQTGYCQSLNFLAAHLLLFMRATYANENYEERAFVLLCIMTEKHLPGTHGLVLEGANVDIGVLMMFIQESMPGLWAKLDDKSEGAEAGSPAISRKGTAGLPTVSLATTAWFMSCFVSTLPVETTCRVWDCLWYEGSKTIFRVALAIFKLGERDIRKSKDPMDMFQVVQNLPRTLLDANTLLEIATKKRNVRGGDSVSSRIGPSVGGFGGLSAKTVERRREERRLLTRMDRERSINPPPIPEEPSAASPARSLSRSSSRAKAGLRRFKSMRKIA